MILKIDKFLDNRVIQFIWMISWQLIFVLFILPWIWLPIGIFENDYCAPKFVDWIVNQADGSFIISRNYKRFRLQ